MILKGEKVILRDKRIEDAWRDYNWKIDPELARLDATLPLDLSFPTYLLMYAEELRRHDGNGRVFAIETLEGRHIGNCSYYNVDRDKSEAELGILIGDTAYWDAGYGTDAVKVLVNYLFCRENLERVYLHTLVWNTRAQKCFQKCGFVVCGRVVRSGYDFILMEMKRPPGHLASNGSGVATPGLEE